MCFSIAFFNPPTSKPIHGRRHTVSSREYFYESLGKITLGWGRNRDLWRKADLKSGVDEMALLLNPDHPSVPIIDG
jgi:hypothetical protein